MLTKQGLGKKPCATRPLSNFEVNKLYSSGYFGTTSPLTLQRNIWWKLTTTFGFRGCDESRRLQFKDVKLCYDSETNQHFLECDKERGTKTRSEENCNSHQRSFNPRAYETGDTRCPVNIYQLFVSHRPIDSLTENLPFFVAMKPQEKITNRIWYSNRPLGKNKSGEFLSNTTSILGQSNTSRSKVANHSAGKTSISAWLNNKIHPLHVIQLSGHKNMDSLNSYHVASEHQQREMSSLLNKQQEYKIDFTVSPIKKH